jgi:hypothetical protein
VHAVIAPLHLDQQSVLAVPLPALAVQLALQVLLVLAVSASIGSKNQVALACCATVSRNGTPMTVLALAVTAILHLTHTALIHTVPMHVVLALQLAPELLQHACMFLLSMMEHPQPQIVQAPAVTRPMRR